VVNVRKLEDAKRRALSAKWYYVVRLCREAAVAARDEDPVKVRQLLTRIEKHTAEAEQLGRAARIVQGNVLKEPS
jgi:hypothetical protein